MACEVHVFDPVNGAHISRMPFSEVSWSDSVSDIGQMTVTIPDCRQLRRIDVNRILREYGSIWAYVDYPRILHAGYVKSFDVDEDGSVTVNVGGGWSLWEKRLVLNHNLSSKWTDGYVLIDEENPPGDWMLTLTGTYSDIARGLVAESLKWGSAPFVLPSVQGGSSHTRNYQCWDFATVSERLGDLADLIDGPEIRFDPQFSGDSIRFRLNVGSPEIIDNKWQWFTGVPRSTVRVTGVNGDGSYTTNQSFGIGGRNEDKLLVAMSVSKNLTGRGWPVLQSLNNEHTSVSELSTLQSYVRGDVANGDRDQLTVGVECGVEFDVHVGDWIDLILTEDSASICERLVSGYASSGVLGLKVTDVSGTSDADVLSLQTRIRDGV